MEKSFFVPYANSLGEASPPTLLFPSQSESGNCYTDYSARTTSHTESKSGELYRDGERAEAKENNDPSATRGPSRNEK